MRTLVQLKDAIVNTRKTTLNGYNVETIAAIPQDRRKPLSLSLMVSVNDCNDADFEREQKRIDQLHDKIVKVLLALS